MHLRPLGTPATSSISKGRRKKRERADVENYRFCLIDFEQISNHNSWSLSAPTIIIISHFECILTQLLEIPAYIKMATIHCMAFASFLMISFSSGFVNGLRA